MNMSFTTSNDLIDRALLEDKEALFQLGKQAFKEGCLGFSQLFLTFADLNHHNRAKDYLLRVNKEINKD